MPVDEFWDEAEVERIIQSIRQPVFPNNPDVYVTQYGARWGATVLGADVAPPDMIDGTAFDSLPAFKAAIEVCSAAGGGRVVVPSGTYFVKGPITLKSNVNLHLQDEDTRIVFSRDPRDYPTVLTQYEANACMNYSPFLYAKDAENIAVTGKGTFDGQAGIGDAGNTTGSRAWAFGQKSNPDVTPPVNMATTGAWLAWKAFTAGTAPRNDIHDDGRLKNSANDDTYVPWADRVFGRDPSFGWEFEHGRKMSTLRPNFVGFWNCQRVLIEGVKFRRSPMWVIAPVLCSEVTVRGVYVESHGTNNDGVNPTCSSQVLIEDCELDTGDDCVAIKSGRGGDGYNFTPDGKGGPRPSHDIVVRNCVLSDGHGAITLGSEISG
ncbi:MAG: hypothetical protein LBU45_05245, partial [Azoarcus sp.]|nr:hypothetical protein [Azoarcus sp.]